MFNGLLDINMKIGSQANITPIKLLDGPFSKPAPVQSFPETTIPPASLTKPLDVFCKSALFPSPLHSIHLNTQPALPPNIPKSVSLSPSPLLTLCPHQHLLNWQCGCLQTGPSCSLSLGFFKSLLFKVARGIFPKHKSSCALLLKTLWWPPRAGRIKTKLSGSQIELGRGVNSILGHEDKKTEEHLQEAWLGRERERAANGQTVKKALLFLQKGSLKHAKS